MRIQIHQTEKALTLPEAVLSFSPSDAAGLGVLDREKIWSELGEQAFEGHQWIFYAMQEGRILARVVARRSPTLKDDNGHPLGMLGYFAAENHPEAVRLLLHEAVAFLRQQGCRRVVGPLNGDTWHAYRFNLGPDDRPPFFLEPANPAYYSVLWEQAGFEVDRDYFSQYLADIHPLQARSEKFFTRSQARGFRFRPFERHRFSEELDLLYDLSCAVFPGNYLYTPTSREAFHALYRPVERLLVPGLIWFAFDESGKAAGYIFMIPDLHRAVQALRNGFPLLRFWNFSREKKKNRTVNLKTIGILPEHRGSALAVGLLHCAYREAIRQGYRHAWHCLIMEGNNSASLDFGQGVRARHYRLYRAPDP